MKSVIKIAAAAAGAMAFAGQVQAANLVSNGSFEGGTFVGGSFGYVLAQQVLPADATTLPGWTTGSAELAWFRSGQANLVVLDGNKALDLTGFNDSAGIYASVSQTIATIIGATYHVSFLGGNYLYNGNVANSVGIRSADARQRV